MKNKLGYGIFTDLINKKKQSLLCINENTPSHIIEAIKAPTKTPPRTTNPIGFTRDPEFGTVADISALEPKKTQSQVNVTTDIAVQPIAHDEGSVKKEKVETVVYHTIDRVCQYQDNYTVLYTPDGAQVEIHKSNSMYIGNGTFFSTCLI